MEKFYKTKVLTTNTNYYWKIIAKDDKDNLTEGIIWEFKTTPYKTFTDLRDGKEYSYNSGATNDFGFSALPGGFNHYKNNFLDIGSAAYFWTSIVGGNDKSWNIPSLYHNNARFYRAYTNKKIMEYGLSVRCIKDE